MFEFCKKSEKDINIKSINELEKYHFSKYNILDTYFANELNYGNLLEYWETLSLDDNQVISIHNNLSINLLFTEYKTRLSCTKSFCNNIPFIKEILSGTWNQKNIFLSKYKDQYNNEIIGSTNIIIENDMESIIFDKNYIFNTRVFKNGRYDYDIISIEINNLLQLILHFNKIRYETNLFT